MATEMSKQMHLGRTSSLPATENGGGGLLSGMLSGGFSVDYQKSSTPTSDPDSATHTPMTTSDSTGHTPSGDGAQDNHDLFPEVAGRPSPGAPMPPPAARSTLDWASSGVGGCTSGGGVEGCPVPVSALFQRRMSDSSALRSSPIPFRQMSKTHGAGLFPSPDVPTSPSDMSRFASDLRKTALLRSLLNRTEDAGPDTPSTSTALPHMLLQHPTLPFTLHQSSQPFAHPSPRTIMGFTGILPIGPSIFPSAAAAGAVAAATSAAAAAGRTQLFSGFGGRLPVQPLALPAPPLPSSGLGAAPPLPVLAPSMGRPRDHSGMSRSDSFQTHDSSASMDTASTSGADEPATARSSNGGTLSLTFGLSLTSPRMERLESSAGSPVVALPTADMGFGRDAGRAAGEPVGGTVGWTAAGAGEGAGEGLAPTRQSVVWTALAPPGVADPAVMFR